MTRTQTPSSESSGSILEARRHESFASRKGVLWACLIGELLFLGTALFLFWAVPHVSSEVPSEENPPPSRRDTLRRAKQERVEAVSRAP